MQAMFKIFHHQKWSLFTIIIVWIVTLIEQSINITTTAAATTATTVSSPIATPTTITATTKTTISMITLSSLITESSSSSSSLINMEKNIHQQSSSSSSSYDKDKDFKLIKKLSDRNEQQSILNAKKEYCEQLNLTRNSVNKQQDFDYSDRKTVTKKCPIVWDGALCWPQTLPNQIIKQSCPSYVKGFNHNGFAYKNCTENGEWYFNEKTNGYWTNYSECFIEHHHSNMNDEIENDNIKHNQTFDSNHYNIIDNNRNNVNNLDGILPHLLNFQIISHVGYSISFISLVIAFLIFIYVKFICRRLRCPRNSLHIQLFISFIMRSLMYLIKTSFEHFPYDHNQLNNIVLNKYLTTNSHNDDEFLSLNDQNYEYHEDNYDHKQQFSYDQQIKNSIIDIENENNLVLLSLSNEYDWANSIQIPTISCKIFTTIWIYSLLANYNWIFMEGLYLHNVIFLNIFNDNSNILPYIILGWCLPIPIVITWALMKSLYENIGCWATNKNLKIFWIMRAPITIVIVLNFLFFVNIIRVLFMKMFAKSAATYARKYKYRTWFRSTLVLVPLFGVHYMFFSAFTSITLNSNDIYEIIWLYSDLTFTTFQGCLVALLYCFFNHEVQIELKKLWISCKQNSLRRRFSFGYNNNSSLYAGGGHHIQQLQSHHQQQTNLHRQIDNQHNHHSSRVTRHSLISNCSTFFHKDIDPNTSSEKNYQHSTQSLHQNNNDDVNNEKNQDDFHKFIIRDQENHDDDLDNSREILTDPNVINKFILINETAI